MILISLWLCRLKEEFDANQQKKNASRKKQKKEEASNVDSEEEPEFWVRRHRVLYRHVPVLLCCDLDA